MINNNIISITSNSLMNNIINISIISNSLMNNTIVVVVCFMCVV